MGRLSRKMEWRSEVKDVSGVRRAACSVILEPVPPGPNNPLGTRWMGLDAPGVGIHGTDEPASIGYSASHGCIRMQVPDAEWLFDHVEVGTTVYIL